MKKLQYIYKVYGRARVARRLLVKLIADMYEKSLTLEVEVGFTITRILGNRIGKSQRVFEATILPSAAELQKMPETLDWRLMKMMYSLERPNR